MSGTDLDEAMKIRTLAGLLVVAAVGIVCVGYAPTNLGGHTTYVSTYGTSMLPRFHAGDLAVVQPAQSYHVGEVVAYHSSVLHNATVLHRIVAINNGRFTFKGDHNDFLDPARPTAAAIVGRLRFRIAHGGAIRSHLVRPMFLFPLLALAIGGAGSGLLTRKRRRRASSHDQQPTRPARTPRDARRRLRVVVPIAATVAAAGFLVATIGVWTTPRFVHSTRRASYQQQLAVGYSAATPKGAAYPDGSVNTGDPIFTRLVKTVDIGLDYTLHADEAPRQVTGTYQVVANVSSATGWSHSVALTPVRAFSGSRLHAQAPLRLEALQALEARFSRETGLVTTAAAISIAPRVHIQGVIAHTPFSGNVASKLDFQLLPDEMTPASSADAAKGASAQRAGSVMIATMRRADVELWKFNVPGDAARVALLVALALGLAGAAALLAIDRRRVALGEIDAINRRYGRLLIAVDAIPPTGDRTMVRVESMRALARLAHLNEQPIVHASRPGGHRFALATDGVMYHYDAVPEPPPGPVMVPGPAPAPA